SSLAHDGSGELPGRKLPTREWDLRPHHERLVHVDGKTLAEWAKLLAYSDPTSVPVVKSVTSAEAGAIAALSAHSPRLGDVRHLWTVGFKESTLVRGGIVERRTTVPASWDEVILEGPQI